MYDSKKEIKRSIFGDQKDIKDLKKFVKKLKGHDDNYELDNDELFELHKFASDRGIGGVQASAYDLSRSASDNIKIKLFALFRDTIYFFDYSLITI